MFRHALVREFNDERVPGHALLVRPREESRGAQNVAVQRQGFPSGGRQSGAGMVPLPFGRLHDMTLHKLLYRLRPIVQHPQAQSPPCPPSPHHSAPCIAHQTPVSFQSSQARCPLTSSSNPRTPHDPAAIHILEKPLHLPAQFFLPINSHALISIVFHDPKSKSCGIASKTLCNNLLNAFQGRPAPRTVTVPKTDIIYFLRTFEAFLSIKNVDDASIVIGDGFG
jgi:hypothetical protein